MNNRIKINSGTSWETKVGYSRAVRVGNIIEVAGTTAMDGDHLIGKNNLYEQTKFIFKKIETSLQQCGASMEHVVRTRMFVTHIEDWEQAATAHAEFFSDIKPVATLVQVSRFINDDLLIEIEATAIV